MSGPDLRIEVPESLAGERLDRILALVADLPRSTAAHVIAAGQVRVDHEPVTQKSARIAAGCRIEVDDLPVTGDVMLDGDDTVPFEVRWEDEHLFVVDKPAGVVVHPGAGVSTGTLVQGLVALDPSLASVGEPDRPGIVHRLDRGTSGLLVVARSEVARSALVGQLAAHTVEREYVALVHGHLDSSTGTIDAPIGRSPRDPGRMAVRIDGRWARTHYRLDTEYHEPVPASSVWCSLETGRTHQIRVHLAAIDHPVIGDSRYGGDDGLAPRPMLHAMRLRFDHPVTGEAVEVVAPPPEDFEQIRARFS